MIANFTYHPLRYFALTFFVTFGCWFAGAYLSHRNADGLHMLLMLPGLMAPFLISMVMIYASRRADVKADFINRLINPRLMRLRMLPVFLFLMPLAVLVSTAISLPLGGTPAQFRFAEDFFFTSGFVPVLLLLLLAATFEELGWRGYAFDSLQSRYNFFTASLVFGIFWSLWHLPLVFVHDSYQYRIVQENLWYGINFYVSIIPLGVIISWVCIKNRKSVLAAVLFHFIVNLSQELLNITQTTKCIETAVLTVVAAAIVILDKQTFFGTGLPASAGHEEMPHEVKMRARH